VIETASEAVIEAVVEAVVERSIAPAFDVGCSRSRRATRAS
jgi:hypothetical protein